MRLDEGERPKDVFQGEIVVAARIIEFVSSGLYESPAACLKELINNSYDADATTVQVFVKPDADRIIIEDNGSGMSRDEFQRHFRRVSESHKRDTSDATKRGRPKIGKIGIGFIAANELCDILEIYSTQKGSTDLLHVVINFARLREEAAEERRRGEEEFAQGDYEGEILSAKSGDHFTRIFLTGVREGAKPMLAGAVRARVENPRSLYGLRPESIVERLRERGLMSWNNFDPYSETMLRVGLNVPVQYAPGWIPSPLKKKNLAEMESSARGLDFKVNYDGTDLRKPIVFFPKGTAITKAFKFEGDLVSASGYFFGQHGTITPYDLSGLLVRIRNAAVGDYDRSFWDYPTSRDPLLQRWVSAEIWASDGLEVAMNIDRQTLRVTHPAYLELQEAIHTQLEAFLKQIRTEIYGVEAASRRSKRASNEVSLIKEVIRERLDVLGTPTRKAVEGAWSQVVRSGRAGPATKKMSVAELYEVVIEVAEEVLEPAALRSFVRALTKRLTDF